MNHTVIPAVAVLAGALALAGCISDSDTPKPDFPLAILHINDHHSNLDEASATLRLATDASGTRSNVTVGMGGFPRVVTAIDELATRHGNVLKLHAGDAITGTLYYTLTEGKSDADLMNEVCFDAMAVGNHEFDAGDAGLRSFIDDLWASPTCRTPLLSANLSLRAGSPIAVVLSRYHRPSVSPGQMAMSTPSTARTVFSWRPASQRASRLGRIGKCLTMPWPATSGARHGETGASAAGPVCPAGASATAMSCLPLMGRLLRWCRGCRRAADSR